MQDDRNDAPVILESPELQVELDPNLPLVRGYRHVSTGRAFGGSRDGTLRVNGAEHRMSDLGVEPRAIPGGRCYRVAVPEQGIAFELAFTLAGAALSLRMQGIEDERAPLTSLQWVDSPLLVCEDPTFRFFRMFTTEPDHKAMGKMWLRDADGAVRDAPDEAEPVPLIYGALYQPDSVCAFLHSNYPLFPQAHRVAGGQCEIHLGEYRHRVRDRVVPPLEADIVFLGDLNQDGRVDASDYRLWVNRRLPDGDSVYRTSLWYKILCDMSGHYPEVGVTATIEECERIIRSIHHVTDGLPQAAFVVNWNGQQPEAAYPALDLYNHNIGTPEEMRALAATCKELGGLLSYHTNIDDAHRTSKDYDEALLGRRYDPHGTVWDEDGEAWDESVIAGISHTRDVESGAIFRRLEAMMRVIPVERTIHMDNIRLTNCEPNADPDGIGVTEELVCGMLPIVEWLRDRGISVSGEGYNGLPIDPTLLNAAFWHHDASDLSRQIFHRKVMGGGRGDHYGGATTMDFGICKSIHQDITYRPVSRSSLGSEQFLEYFPWLHEQTRATLSFLDNWDDIVDRIYRGSLLNLFYLEREMLSWDKEGDGARIRFAGGVESEVCIDGPDHLHVTWGDVVVADGDDRFVPLGDGVYCYSLRGGRREWTLPVGLRGRQLALYSLSREGRGAAPEHSVDGDRLTLTLAAGVPVKVTTAGANA